MRGIGVRRASGTQRPRKLTEIAGRFGFVDAVLRRPAVGGQVQGPEQGVQNWELSGVVGVVGVRFTSVMQLSAARTTRAVSDANTAPLTPTCVPGSFTATYTPCGSEGG